MKFQTDQLLLYAVTDRKENSQRDFLEQVEMALQNGVTMLQLREKELEDEAFVEEAIQVKKICEKYHVPLLINDRLEVAIKCGADGVHVGASDLPVREIRKRMGRDFIIGATAKTIIQAESAEREGADYLGVGAVFPSVTKKNAIRITQKQLREICTAVSIPTVAIGGITKENVLQLADTHIHGIAVVSALFGAKDMGSAATELAALAKTVIKQR